MASKVALEKMMYMGTFCSRESRARTARSLSNSWGSPLGSFRAGFFSGSSWDCRTRISTRAWPLSRLSAWGPSFSRGYSPWVCSKYPWSTSARATSRRVLSFTPFRLP